MKEHLPPASNQAPTKFGTTMWEMVRFVVIALIVIVPIRWLIAEPVKVEGSSMVPTFHDKDYLIVNKLSYHFDEIARGDVIVFEFPGTGRGIMRGRLLIKRAIGLPGETVEIKNNIVTIINEEHPEGLVLSEPYLTDVTTEGVVTVTLDDDEFFVMGDNRPHSSDSRSWGPLQEDNIVGRAALRLSPLSQIEVRPGHIVKFTDNQ